MTDIPSSSPIPAGEGRPGPHDVFLSRKKASATRLLGSAVLLWFALPACAAETGTPVLRTRYLMGTLCEITAYGERAHTAITHAFDEIGRLERVMSTYIKESELSRLNREAALAPTRVSDDLWEVLTRSLDIARKSRGAFDPTFSSPPEARGAHRVTLLPETRAVRLAPGTRLNLGGIGKGYALDAAAAVLGRAGVKDAMLNFGGQILALGSPPGAPNWRVELASPGCAGPCGTALVLGVRDRSVSTSGLDERPGHILDPRSGRVLRRAGSVTVVGPDAAMADAWSTALLVSGLAKAPPGFDGCAIALSPDSSRSKMLEGDSSRSNILEGTVPSNILEGDSSGRVLPAAVGDCSPYLEASGPGSGIMKSVRRDP